MDELIEGEVYWWEPSIVSEEKRWKDKPRSLPQWVVVTPFSVSDDDYYLAARLLDGTKADTVSSTDGSFVVASYELFNLDNDGGLVPLKEWNE